MAYLIKKQEEFNRPHDSLFEFLLKLVKQKWKSFFVSFTVAG